MFISGEQARRISVRVETGIVSSVLTKRDELFRDHFQDDSISFSFFLANLGLK